MFVVDSARVGGVWVGEVGVAAAPAIEVDMLPGIGFVVRRVMVARAEERGVVLGAAEDVVWCIVVRPDRVEFSDRHVVHVEPAFAAVIAEVKPAVVPEDDAIDVERIDPEGMRKS